ncbi:alpha/beta fold hydrolase [Thalassotalea euphylliae]|uniref:Alpha/beta fold hydrolase n=1 Tax=Thalassotalea euphylliae TaxID=1655234 RepID=A0A3E0TN09_9GAMM|nr:alpha/beta hydrolase [Thalassotalea euphylliae]REL25936.1 alpha/beta fold hydrolase [Thalassotalea euphylliae]
MWKAKRKAVCSALLASGLLTSSMLSLAADSEQLTTQSSKLSLENCHIDGIKEQIQCGTLTVPENYQAPSGQQIDLHFTVLSAIDNSNNKIPLMFLAGGPGQAATELSAMLRNRFYEVRKTHDIILVDQRGTGQSSQLKCHDEAFTAKSVYESLTFDFEVSEVQDCIAEFNQDLSQYNSENAIRDFDAVRAALGHDKINIYGGSYGTRAALIYMRMFPQSLNSVVLDSVAPLDMRIGLFGQSGARSYELLLSNCQAEESCQQAFPNLDEDYQKVFNQLVVKPVELTIAHPRLGTPTKLVIDVEKFVTTIQLQLYSLEGRSIMPLVINQAAQGNFMPFVGVLAAGDEKQPRGSVYSNLLMNIACNEDFPLIAEQDWQADANNGFARNISHRGVRLVCPLWPKYRPDASFYEPIRSDIPTLILSGKLDPVTPPENGERADQMLANSRHIVAEHLSHIVAVNDCGVGLVAKFIDELDLEGLDASCLAELPAETFMTSLNGNM